LRRLAVSCFAILTIVATAMPLPAYARSAPESFADLARK
jgi:serine protease Do